MQQATRLKPLWKVSGYLRGIAILFVIINHAAFFGVMNYRFELGKVIMPIPLFGLSWKMTMPGWTILQELTRVALPLFFVLAGQSTTFISQTLKAAWGQVKKISLPFIFWSLVAWVLAWIYNPPGWNAGIFLKHFFLGETQPGYFFFPLIIQYYLLGPWLVPLVKRKPRFVLAVAGIIQLGWISCNYLSYAVRGGVLGFPFLLNPLPDSFFPRFLFFYALGLWIGCFPDRLSSVIKGRGWLLAVLSVICAFLMIAEHGIILCAVNKTKETLECWEVFTAMIPWKLSTNLWSLVFILLLFYLGQLDFISSKWLSWLGSFSLVFFILNGPLLTTLMPVLAFLSLDSRFHWIVFLLISLLSVFIPYVIAILIRKWAPWAGFVIGDSLKPVGTRKA